MSDTAPSTGARSRAPGVSWQDIVVPTPPPFLTGIPAFLGYAGPGATVEPDTPVLVTLWPRFEPAFGSAPAEGHLATAVRGFFENGGLACYVVRLREAPVGASEALASALAAIEVLDAVDLVCAPDIVGGTGSPPDAGDLARVAGLQWQVLAHCQNRGDRFAILDCLNVQTLGSGGDPGPGPGAAPGAAPVTVAAQRAALGSGFGALYHPWLLVAGPSGEPVAVPPCGHVAGVYARTDAEVGFHKAPANAVLEGVLDVRQRLTEDEAGSLNDLGINTIRAFPGRGLRVWGARTLDPTGDPMARYVNVRRLFTTVARWLEQFLAPVTFETNDVGLWLRIMRELSAYCEDLHRRGALKGRTPEEAFYVKCDSDTNPPAVIRAGQVVTELGLAPIAPAEFIVVRVVHGESGVSLAPAIPSTAP